MVGASKILTVSYGTFSCTLEGFDDPFSTMKAIAEYFRDLAADDRYFGAEPPTPDAQMLHQIAEREVHRRVEAKIQENGVVLKADADAQPAAIQPAAVPAARAEAAPAAAIATPEVPTAAPQAAAPQPAAPQPAPQAPAAEAVQEPAELTARPEPESVAAKLLRIRAAVELAREGAAAAQTAQTPAPAAAPIAAAQVEEDYVEDEEVAETSETEFAPETEKDVAEQHVAEQDVAEAAPAALPDAGFEAEDDAQAEDEDGALSQVMQALAANPSEAEAAAEMPEAAAETTEAPQLEDTVGSFIDAMADDEDAEQETAGDDLVAEAPAATPVAEPLARARARVIKVRRVDPQSAPEIVHEDEDESETPIAAEQAEDTSEEEAAEAPQAEVAFADEDQDDDAGWDVEDDEDVAAHAEPAHVAPLRLEPAHASAAPEEDYDDDGALAASAQDDEDEDAETPASGLSPEAEAELQAELAAVEREVEAHRRNDRGGRSILGDSTDDDAMTRLMRQTENQMEGAENRRRLSTIAHLKAAVAAKEADEKLGAETEENLDEALRSYRDDLARVVRPRRPVAGEGGTTQRPAAPADRPAPLMLVSEQRIDRPSEPARAPQPIRPRRINTSNLALNEDQEDELEDDLDNDAFADSRSFAEFADRIGATSLPDLLEAAAAYSNCVEGREHFTRPQIMRFAATVSSDGGDADGFSREAGLRSFGALLREGKIKKVKRGQFAISQSSRFIPEARKMVR